jgi:hypothetical protein
LKNLIFILCLTFSLFSQAETLKIFEARNDYFSRVDVSPAFEINFSLNRAWVNVVISEFSGDSTTYEDNKVKIEGLSYDPEQKSIILERNGEKVVCAYLYNKRFVIDQGRSIKLTNRCKFEVKNVITQVDNGFEIQDVEMIEVLMHIK